MKNANVVFATKTGHSKAIAEAIGKKLGVEAGNILRQPRVSGVDLLILVGGIYAGKSNPDMVAFAQTLPPAAAKAAILVTSSASVSNRSQKQVREALVRNGIQVMEEVSCTGAFLFLKRGHPDQAEIQGIAVRVLELAG